MPKIPEYEQGRLASALVGTPGVDLSGAHALQSAAQGFGALADTIFGVQRALGEDALSEARRKKAELRSLQNHIESAQRSIRVGAAVQGVDVQLTDLDNEIRGKYQNNTAGAAQEWQKRALEISKTAFQNVEDPLDNLEIQKALQEKNANYLKGLSDWSKTREIPNAAAGIEQMAGNFSMALNNGDLTVDQVDQKVLEYDKNIGAYQYIHGASAAEHVRRDQENGIKNYLADTAIKHPELLDGRINHFDHILNAEDKQSFYAKVKANANEVDRQNKFNETVRKQGVQMNVTTQLISASKTGDINDADPGTTKKLLQTYGKDLTPELIKSMEESSAKTQVKFAKEQDETTSIKYLGGYTARLEKMAGQIETLYEAAGSEKDPKRHTAMTARLQLLIGQYDDEFKAINKLKSSLTSAEAKNIAETHILRSTDRFNKISSLLRLEEDKGAVAAKKAKSLLSGQIGTPNIYSDPKKQALFNYYFNSYFDNEMPKMTAQRAKAIYSNVKDREVFKNGLKQRAVFQVEHFGFIK